VQIQSWLRLLEFNAFNVETTETVKKNRHWPLVVAGAVLAIVGVAVFAIFAGANRGSKIVTAGLNAPPSEQVALHKPLPKEVRGVYVTAATVSNLKRLDDLLASVKAKGVNTIVLDVKTEGGSLSFEPLSPALKIAPIKKIVPDLDKVVAEIHNADFYLIARIPVFEDPAYANKNPKLALKQAGGGLWHDANGLAWLDPSANDAWAYNAAISREVYGRGFDEIQFDYIRFATDGKTSNIVFPIYDAKKENKRAVIGKFFAYLDKELRGSGIPISADVFGFTTWHQNDLGIGQWYADALAYFDFVSPMVYPSHYPPGTLGYKNPAAHPYEIVLDSMKKGNEVIAEMSANPAKPKIGLQRPWIQAFNMGAIYTPELVMAQVRAARETGCSGFLFWNASNKYLSLPELGP
jgi:hypothetical protein